MRLLPLLAAAASLALLAGCPSRVNTANDIVVGEAPASPDDPAALDTVEPDASAPSVPAKPTATSSGPVYILRETGIVCIRSPCPSWSAVNVETRQEISVSGIDLSKLPIREAAKEAAHREILAGQWWVRGELHPVGESGPKGPMVEFYVTEMLRADQVPVE